MIKKEKFFFAVILHLFYEDLIEENLFFLKKSPICFDLFISTTQEIHSVVLRKILPIYPDAKIYVFKNRGRDIGPFFEIIKNIDISHYTCICKLHTKKTLRIDNGDSWRKDLYEKLFGDSEYITNILNIFKENKNIGIVAPKGHLLLTKKFIGSNEVMLKIIAEQAGLFFNLENSMFIAGSMFWFKPDALAPLLRLNISIDDFEEESNQPDGTLAHAIERLFFVSSFNQNYWTIDTDIAKEILKQNITQQNYTSFIGKNNLLIAQESHMFSPYKKFTWKSDFFENGIFVSSFFKKIYNERPDLQQEYLNPSLSNSLDTYYGWLILQGPYEYPELLNGHLFFKKGIPFTKIHWDIYKTRIDLQKKYQTSLYLFYQWLITQGPHEYPELLNGHLFFKEGIPFKKIHWDIYKDRPDLQRMFDKLKSQESLKAFYCWLTTQGLCEYPDLLEN